MLITPIIPQKIGVGASPQFASVSAGNTEIIKSGNSPGDNGNCRWIIDGDDVKLQSKVGGSWADTGIAFTIA